MNPPKQIEGLQLAGLDVTLGLEHGECSIAAADLNKRVHQIFKLNPHIISTYMEVDEGGLLSPRQIASVDVLHGVELEDEREVSLMIGAYAASLETQTEESPAPLLLFTVVRGDIALPVASFSRRPGQFNCDYVQIGEEMSVDALGMTATGQDELVEDRANKLEMISRALGAEDAVLGELLNKQVREYIGRHRRVGQSEPLKALEAEDSDLNWAFRYHFENWQIALQVLHDLLVDKGVFEELQMSSLPGFVGIPDTNYESLFLVNSPMPHKLKQEWSGRVDKNSFSANRTYRRQRKKIDKALAEGSIRGLMSEKTSKITDLHHLLPGMLLMAFEAEHKVALFDGVETASEDERRSSAAQLLGMLSMDTQIKDLLGGYRPLLEDALKTISERGADDHIEEATVDALSSKSSRSKTKARVRVISRRESSGGISHIRYEARPESMDEADFTTVDQLTLDRYGRNDGIANNHEVLQIFQAMNSQ